jgi:hypothetical protein
MQICGRGFTLLPAICGEELFKQVGRLVVLQWSLPINDDMSCRPYSLDDMSQSPQHRRVQRDLYRQKGDTLQDPRWILTNSSPQAMAKQNGP